MKNDSAESKLLINRRNFLKSGALGAGAVVTLSGCGAKEDKLIPLLVPEDRIIPGVDKWTASTCSLCPAGCGTLVRSMPGEVKFLQDGQEKRRMVLQVKKIEGNPKSPINHGRLCVRGQAAPQVTYNPDRIKTPLRLAGPRGSGKFQSISWDEALALLEQRLAAAGAGLAALCGPMSQSRRQLMSEFVAAAGSKRCFFEEAPGVPTLREANRRMFGRSELDLHDFENTRYVLSFGADFLETHTSPVRYSLGLTRMRQGRAGERGKLVQVESRFSLTAANADEWLPARPGTEASLALAMAHVIIKEELFDKSFVGSQVRGFEGYRSWVLEKYSPDRVAEEIDIPSGRIARVAREFARHRPSLAFAGGTALAHSDGLFTALAVQSLNALAGSIGEPGGVFWNVSSVQEPAGDPQVRYWAEDFLAAADSVSVLMLLNADPVYSTPAAMGLGHKLEKIPFIIAFGTVIDDSASYADLVLPDQTSLERWDVIRPEVTAGSRVLSVNQPIIRSLYESRDSADVLLSLAAKLDGKARAALPAGDFKQYLRNDLQKTELKHGSFEFEDLDEFWDKFLEEGVWIESAAPARGPAPDLAAVRDAEPRAGSDTGSTEYPFYLQPFIPAGVGMGREADLPWMQELPDPMTSIVWGSWVEMNPSAAKRLGIEDSEWVWLESAAGKIKVPVLLQPAARPDTVSMPFGQGHENYGRYAAGRGVNAWQVLAPVAVHGTSETAWAATKVRVVRTGEKAPLIKLGYDRERSPAELHR